MRRKLVMITMAVLLPMGFVATIGAGVAAASKTTVTFDGNISCNLSGSAKIVPAITSTSTGPYVVTAKLKNSDCIGLSGTSTTQGGVTLKKSTEDVTVNIPAGSPGCGSLLGGGTYAVPPITVKWSPSTITETVLGAATVTITPGSPNTTLNLTGNVTSGWSTPPAATYEINLGLTTATLAKDCASKAGLKSLKMNDLGGDNLEIGPNF